jgi:hypothetical protein
LREDPKYELTRLTAQRPDYLKTITEDYRKRIEAETAKLARKAETLTGEIKELTGSAPAGLEL